MSSVGAFAPANPAGAFRTVPRGRMAVGVASVAMLFAVDVLMVTAAFMVAYFVRFVVSGSFTSALPVEHYVRTGLAVGIAAALLMPVQGLGELERRRSWPTRLRVITSSVSTGAVVAMVFSFDQDQRLSRAWLAIGWSLSIGMVLQAVLLWQIAAVAERDSALARPMIAAFVLNCAASVAIAAHWLFPMPALFAAVMVVPLALAWVKTGKTARTAAQ